MLDKILRKVNRLVFGFPLLLIKMISMEKTANATQYEIGTYSFDSEAVSHNKMAALMCQ